LAWRVRDSKKSLRIRLEDRNHFEALIPRIYELGGEIPRDIRDFVWLPVLMPTCRNVVRAATVLTASWLY